MRDDDPHTRLVSQIKGLLRARGLSEEEVVALASGIPRKWERFSDVALLPASSFRNGWDSHCDEELWTSVATALGAKRLGRAGEIEGQMRESTVEMLLGEEDWVVRRESGVDYGYNLTKCMFSAGNINERRRMGEMVAEGEVVLDLYAGIGYYSLPILVHSRVGHVHCCEWNPNAIKALESNLEANGVSSRCTVHFGDNLVTTAVLEGVADRVLLGLLPTSQGSYAVAMRSLSRDGGVLHIHGIAPSKDHLSWVEEVIDVLGTIDTGRRIEAGSPIRVKSYAPHWDHVVLDVSVR